MSPNADMRLSLDGERFIAGFEGVVLHPYDDGGPGIGNATIGIGHLIHLGVFTQADVDRYRGFTLADAYALLGQDVASTEASIRDAITRSLNQNEWDALVSLVFNTGPGVLAAGIAADINAGEMVAAANAWQAWCHANGQVLAGLVRRRQAERALFLTPPPAPAWQPVDERKWCAEWDTPLAPKARPKLRFVMHARASLIWTLAHKAGPVNWGFRNRGVRFQALWTRLHPPGPGKASK